MRLAGVWACGVGLAHFTVWRKWYLISIAADQLFPPIRAAFGTGLHLGALRALGLQIMYFCVGALQCIGEPFLGARRERQRQLKDAVEHESWRNMAR